MRGGGGGGGGGGESEERDMCVKEHWLNWRWQMAYVNLRLMYDKWSSKKGVSQVKAPRELGLFPLCSKAQNLISSGARKKWFFFANFAVISWEMKFRLDLENF